jgi:hypothetical protein
VGLHYGETVRFLLGRFMKFEVFTRSCDVIVSFYPENVGGGALGNRARFEVLTGRDCDAVQCGRLLAAFRRNPMRPSSE